MVNLGNAAGFPLDIRQGKSR